MLNDSFKDSIFHFIDANRFVVVFFGELFDQFWSIPVTDTGDEYAFLGSKPTVVS